MACMQRLGAGRYVILSLDSIICRQVMRVFSQPRPIHKSVTAMAPLSDLRHKYTLLYFHRQIYLSIIQDKAMACHGWCPGSLYQFVKYARQTDRACVPGATQALR